MKPIGYLSCFLLFIGLFGCTKEITNNNPNPFAGIKPVNHNVKVELPDSATIVGLHQYTFKRTCALSGCHDGTFEPDFRTVQSSYSTLVYQPIIKNNATHSFKYRVKPSDYKMSWLHEKVITDNPIISRMPVNLPALSSGEVKAIRKWIEGGAKDMFGYAPDKPNGEPNFYGFASIVNFNGLEFRIDTIRGGNPTSPFVLPKNVPNQQIPISDVDIWVGVIDRGEDSTAVDQLQINELMISDKMDDFSNAKVIKATWVKEGKIIQKFFGNQPGIFFWKVKINPQEYQKDKIYFFRYKVSDGKQSRATIFPNESSPLYLKTYGAFVVVN